MSGLLAGLHSVADRHKDSADTAVNHYRVALHRRATRPCLCMFQRLSELAFIADWLRAALESNE